MTTPQVDTSAIFVFPGIGVESSGREKALFSRYASLYRPFFDEASEAAHLDLGEALLADTVSVLTERQNQLFIYAFSAGTSMVCIQHGRRPVCAAGYSFGIYAALYAAGALSFSECRAVLEMAYDLIAACRTARPIGMCAVIGLQVDELLGIIVTESLDEIYHSNSNNEFCHLFCGDKRQILRLNRAAADAGAVSAVELAVSLPYHHPGFTGRITGPFGVFCDRFTWHAPAIPLYSTMDFRPLPTAGAVRDFVVRHLTAPINWYRTVEQLYVRGCTHMVECGPGISLTQNARFIPGTVKWINCKNIDHWIRQ